MTKIVAVIPCYNEEEFIGSVVDWSIPMCTHVVVSDDNSVDKTATVALDSGAVVCYNPGYLHGAGAATRRGIELALRMGADIVVTLDGDRQHDPLDIEALVKPILDDEADITVGSRFMTAPCELQSYRRLGIQVITQSLNIKSSVKFSDGQCCFRAHRRNVLERIKITEDGFPFSVEMLIKARKLGFRIMDIPVCVTYHTQFEYNSSHNPVTHGLHVLLGVVKWRAKVELLKSKI